MASQILEGTLSEIQQQIKILNLKPERRVRLVLEEEDAELEAIRRRKGVRLFPRTNFDQVITTEMISDLLDQADYEDAYPTS